MIWLLIVPALCLGSLTSFVAAMGEACRKTLCQQLSKIRATPGLLRYNFAASPQKNRPKMGRFQVSGQHRCETPFRLSWF